jgi:hypothetical protein
VRRSSSTTRTFAGSAAFRSSSHTARATSYLRGMGDPGAHDPLAFTSIGSLSARSFNSSERVGAGGFGSVSARPGFKPGFGPGPATANQKVRPKWITEGRRLSAGFLTNVRRSDYLIKGNVKVPSPDTYNPSRSLKRLEKRTVGGDSTFKGTPRFDAATTAIDSSPGPGHYELFKHTLVFGAREKLKAARGQTSTRADLFRPPRVRV